MRRTFSVLTALIVTALAWPLDARALLIDSFDALQLVTAPPGMTVTSTVTSGGGDILGVERDISVTAGPGVTPTSLHVNEFANGLAIYSQGATDPSGSASITWDGGVGLGVDLTQGGTDTAFSLGLVFADLPTTLTFTVYTDGANASQAPVALSSPIVSPTDLLVAYADFVPSLGVGADFSNVNAIVLTLGGGAGVGIGATSLQTIPEPAVEALVALGIGGLVLAGRRGSLISRALSFALSAGRYPPATRLALSEEDDPRFH